MAVDLQVYLDSPCYQLVRLARGETKMQWEHLLRLIADVITIVGVPVLVATTWDLYRKILKDGEFKSVSQDCLEFSDRGVGINLVPLDRVSTFPRPGDTVFLPGQTAQGKNHGGGDYEVETISFSYREAPEIDQPCPALPSKVIVKVRKR